MLGITNALIEGVFLGSITFDQGAIVAVYKNGDVLPEKAEWVDACGQELYPAFIDVHDHDRPDEPHKEDVNHLEAACIAGGVGTIMTMPNDKIVPFTHPDQLEQRKERWRDRKITVRHHIAVSRDNMDIISHLGEFKDGSLGHVKEYDASTSNPNTLIDDEQTQYKASEATGKGGKIRIVHSEYEPWLKRTRQQIERQHKLQIQDHCLLRDGSIEIMGIYQAILVAKNTHTPTHIAHVSTAGGIELIQKAQDAGVDITLETCPHYWLLNEDAIKTKLGFAKMNPALRDQKDADTVAKALCDGTVTMVATDHAPHTPKEKSSTEYDQCPSGVPGVETVLLSTYQFKHNGWMTAQRFVDVTSRNAAKRFGFNKGALQPGLDADMVLIDPRQTTTYTNATQKSKCGWTYLDGVTLNGRITKVILKGKMM